MTVASNNWIADYATGVATAYNADPYVDPEHETFAFRNCAPQVSEWSWYLPAMLEVAGLYLFYKLLGGVFSIFVFIASARQFGHQHRYRGSCSGHSTTRPLLNSDYEKLGGSSGN